MESLLSKRQCGLSVDRRHAAQLTFEHRHGDDECPFVGVSGVIVFCRGVLATVIAAVILLTTFDQSNERICIGGYLSLIHI